MPNPIPELTNRQSRGKRAATVWAAVVAVAIGFIAIVGNPYDGSWYHLKGKVVDQTGAGVPGAVVTIRVGRRAGPINLLCGLLQLRPFDDDRLLVSSTSANGEFSAYGFGMTARIAVAKPGYLSDNSESWTDVDLSARDSGRRSLLVYHVWKLNGPQPLITSGFRIPGDGKTRWLDFVHGKVLDSPEGADMSINLETDPIGTSAEQTRMSYTLQGIEGGFAPTKEQLQFLAPLAGYRDIIRFGPGAIRHGFDIPKEHYYLRSRNNAVYSRLDVQWEPDMGYADIEYYSNTAGSPILELGLEKRPE